MDPNSLAITQIEAKIYLIRSRKVMLDSDLSNLYRVTTFNLNKTVKRNLARFPQEIMFRLSDKEFRDLLFQNGMSSFKTHGGRRSLPFVFTQEGVSMLSSILRSEHAIQVNVMIMRAFVRLREMTFSHEDLLRKIEALENRYDHQFETVFTAIRELMSNHAVPPKRIIGLGNKDD